MFTKVFSLALLLSTTVCIGTEEQLSKQSLSMLEERLTAIDAELSELARYSLRSGVGSIGFRSELHTSSEPHEWVEVKFNRAYPIDEIVLVPALWRDSKNGFQSDAFPAAFRIVAGMDNSKGSVIATYSSTDGFLPRIAPLIIHTEDLSASWIRIEATQLSKRAFDGNYVFQLSELMVFSAQQNVALRRPVTASSWDVKGLAHAWDMPYLVDGYMPYLMDAATGDSSVAYIASIKKHNALTVDLGEPYRISGIHLHTVDQSDTVPQAYSGSLGLPEKLTINGGLKSDLSDASPLLEVELKSLTDSGPIMMWPLSGTSCRYVQITVPEGTPASRFGFAEIEIFAKNQNIALYKTVRPQGGAPLLADPPNRSLINLTDGRNLYGNIIPIRSWMAQLARRHDLEIERPVVVAALDERYTQQKRNLRGLAWLAALLAVTIGFILLIDRILRLRQAQKIRLRFAADLHDELGANIHSIGLLTDLAREPQTHEQLLELLDHTRTFTQRSGTAVRYFTNSLETNNLCADLVEEMKRSSDRMLGDIEHDLLFDGEDILHELKPHKRIDIFFFYKEALNNIVQHAGATHASVRLVATAQYINLTITDNGRGIQPSPGRIIVPRSLKRRANLMGARVSAEQVPEGGTRVQLKLKTKGRMLWRT